VKSTNSGTNWTTISSFASSVGTLVSLDVAPTNPQMIVAASNTKVMLTTNGGTSWTDITTGLPGTSILRAYFDPNNSNNIYVGLASYAGTPVYISNNAGSTWTSYSTGLPNVPVNTFVVQSNGDAYCGTDIGVYIRSSGAASWTAYTTGMPGVPVYDVKINVAAGNLIAATYGRGIWSSPLNSVNIPPTVSITSPANNAVFYTGSNVVINATAADADGKVAKVDFYNGSTLLGTSTASPYTYTWTAPAVGTYVLTAKATDNQGAVTTSTAVNITVALLYDAGISAVVAPKGTISTASVIPSVTLNNYGSTALTATTITYKVDNGTASTYNWSGNLAKGASVNVSLPSVTGYTAAAHTFTAQTGLVNGNADGNAANNSATSNAGGCVTPANNT